MDPNSIPDEWRLTVHPLVAGLLLGWVLAGATFAATVSWWWAAAGGVVGFAAGWWCAAFARRAESTQK